MDGISTSKNVFFEQFLKISDFRTLIFLGVLGIIFMFIYMLQKKKVKFSTRVITATAIGLVLGLIVQLVSGFNPNPTEITFVKEVTTWFGLFGNGFIDLIRMLVVPLVMVSIIHVIINMENGANIGKLTKTTLIITMIMVSISAIIGLLVGLLFNLGEGISANAGNAEIKNITSVVDTIRNLIPANPIEAMVKVNIISIVVFASFIGVAARRMSKKYESVIKPFFDLINALNKIIVSIAMSIIKFMPYAVVALLASTIAQKGLRSILEVGKFIIALYVAAAVMFVIQLIALALFKVNPITYIKKSLSVMIFAFTSRSSVGTLPLTIDLLNKKLGVSSATSSFVAGFGTTAGMQGCAGIFPPMIIIFVCNMAGIPIDINLIFMSIIVISIGSLGISGIPGTASVAASVALSGVGMAAYFPLISPILAIDPLIDMGRTLINVTGSITSAIMVDIKLKNFDIEKYNDMNLKTEGDNTSLEI